MYYIIEDFERKLFKVIIPLSVHLILGCLGKKKCEALGFPVSGRCPGRMVFFPRWTCTKVGRRKFKNCYRTTLENTFSGKITRSWPHRTDRQGKTIGKKIDSSSKIKKTTIWSLPVRWTKKKQKKTNFWAESLIEMKNQLFTTILEVTVAGQSRNTQVMLTVCWTSFGSIRKSFFFKKKSSRNHQYRLHCTQKLMQCIGNLAKRKPVHPGNQEGR